MNRGKLLAHVLSDYGPDETDFKRGKKASNSLMREGKRFRE